MMTAQPIHPHDPDRVPRTAQGIAAALSAERRTVFCEELMAATPEEAAAVLRRWWCEAQLDTDPAGDRLTAEALAGTLPTTTVADLIERRRRDGLPVE